MIDKFGRKINYLRVSLTEQRNLNYVYCRLENEVSKSINYKLSLDEYKFFIKSICEMGVNKVMFTDIDVSLSREFIELVRFTKEECMIDDIGITTNGYEVYEIIRELSLNGLKRINVNLDSLKEYKYKSITGVNLKGVLKTIEYASRLKLNIKINCLAIDGLNGDEIYDFVFMTKSNPVDVKFIELEQNQFDENDRSRYLDVNEVIQNINSIQKLSNIKNTTSNYYRLTNSKGKIGVKSLKEVNACGQCSRIMLTSYGSIKFCDHSTEEIDIYQYANKPMLFKEFIKEIMLSTSSALI